MPKDVKNEWMDEDLGDPGEGIKSLDEISVDRQKASDEAAMMPPPPPPMPVEAPADPTPKPDPISDKDLAKLLEDSAKSLLDAAHNIDKSNTNLKKILAKLSFSGDAEVQSKVDSIMSGMDDLKNKVQSMADAISGYRQEKISGETTIL